MPASKIILSDGRRGVQYTYDDDPHLLEIVVTRRADGLPCRHVYSTLPSSLSAQIFSLSDLGHGVTWEIDE